MNFTIRLSSFLNLVKQIISKAILDIIKIGNIKKSQNIIHLHYFEIMEHPLLIHAKIERDTLRHLTNLL